MNNRKNIFTVIAAAVLVISTFTVTTVFALSADREQQPAQSNNIARNISFDPTKISDSLLADFLGISMDELKSILPAKGGNLYAVLVEAGKVAEYKQLWLDTATSRLEEYIEKGKLTREKAEIRYNKFSAELSEWDGTTDINEIFKIIK